MIDLNHNGIYQHFALLEACFQENLISISSKHRWE